MSQSPKVSAAIVAYRPDADTLCQAASAVATQVEELLIVANDGGGGWCFSPPKNAIIVRQKRNIGLGAAYNLAAQWARSRGSTHLLLLDQDSIPAPGMVAALLRAFEKSKAVAAAGPLWRDSRSGEEGFFVRGARVRVHKFRPSSGEIAPVDFLISSGSLISLEALTEIGPFDESLFIEHVDTDWSLRAAAKGYRLFGVAEARLDHAFGEATLSIPLFRGRRLYLYPPERNYYLLRNSMLLWRRSHAPWPWVRHDIRRTMSLALVYVLWVPPRLTRLRCMMQAVRDALKVAIT